MSELQQVLYKAYGVPHEVGAIIEEKRKTHFRCRIDECSKNINFAILLRLYKLGIFTQIHSNHVKRSSPRVYGSYYVPTSEERALLMILSDSLIAIDGHVENNWKLTSLYHLHWDDLIPQSTIDDIVDLGCNY